MPDPGPVALGAATGASRVLVIDDSLVVRHLLRRVIDSEPGFRVVGEADDGRQALAKARTLRPDLIVLDLEMPGLSGYRVLDGLRNEGIRSRVVVFANVEPEDRDRTEQAVRSAGAELVVKPTGVADAGQAMAEIRACLLDPLRRSIPAADPPRPGNHRVIEAVVIASSTGGPNALEVVLGDIVELRVPVFIVQHIAEGFSSRLADRLDSLARFPVHEAVDGQRPEAGSVHVGPGGLHLVIERDADGPVLRLRDWPPVNSCRPSADVLFTSSAEVYGGNQLGLVLTGIGRDGTDGCRQLADRGAHILVQDEVTSVVWGMPGSVAEAGLADEIVPIEAVAGRIERLTHRGVPALRLRGSDR